MEPNVLSNEWLYMAIEDAINQDSDSGSLQVNGQITFLSGETTNIQTESISTGDTNPDSSFSPQHISNTMSSGQIQLPNNNIMGYCETPCTPSPGLEYHQLAPMTEPISIRHSTQNSDFSPQHMSYFMSTACTQTLAPNTGRI